MNGLTKAHTLSSIEETLRANLGLDSNAEVVSKIVEIIKELPDNANAISPPHAEYLAGRFLKGLDFCNELYALSIGYELKCEIFKKKSHGEAFIIRSKTRGLKTAKEMEAYANTDEIYISAAERHAESKMLRVLVENIRSDLEKSHYLMRKIAEKDVENDHTKSDPTPSVMADDWSEFVADDAPTQNKRTPW